MSSGTEPTASALDSAPPVSSGKASPDFWEEEQPCPTSRMASNTAANENDFPGPMMHLLRERISAKRLYLFIIKEKIRDDKK
jgi:hypothetical protein